MIFVVVVVVVFTERDTLNVTDDPVGWVAYKLNYDRVVLKHSFIAIPNGCQTYPTICFVL